MQRTTMMLLLALQLPATDPVRIRALSVLAPRLAQEHQERRWAEEEAAELERLRARY